MGRAASGKRTRREVAEAAGLRAWYNRQLARPEVADAELQARLKADNPGQRTRLRRAGWTRAAEGNDGIGWWAQPQRGQKMIHSVSREADGHLWGHFSMSLYGGELPGWYELRDMQWLLYPDLTGMQLAVPQAAHVSIAEVAHMWTCLTADLLPAFGRLGSI
jgi:hypothetical protein